MIKLDAASVLLQWSVGGLFFLWVTTRHRKVSLGYGWLMRATYIVFALAAFGFGVRFGPDSLLRDLSALAVVVLAGVALVQSYRFRGAGVVHQRELVEARTARVAAMTGIDRSAKSKDVTGPEFDPRLDLLAPAVGFVGVVAAAVEAGGPAWLAVSRMIIGTLFLGAISDAMMLGHWYLVQPGLERAPLSELVRWSGIMWVPEVLLLLVPTGMISVLSGEIDDGWAGMLGWFWAGCAVTTIGLIYVTVAALKGREYSAVMAATGLLYLAILTSFGTDLVARALLS